MVFDCDLLVWNVSNVTSMRGGMFHGCRAFSGQSPDVSDMLGKLFGVVVFDTDLSGWDVPRCSRFAPDLLAEELFIGMYRMGIHDVDVRRLYTIQRRRPRLECEQRTVRDFSHMFVGCTAFQRSSIAGWNISGVARTENTCPACLEESEVIPNDGR